MIDLLDYINYDIFIIKRMPVMLCQTAGNILMSRHHSMYIKIYYLVF